MWRLDYAGNVRGHYERPKENGWKCHFFPADPAERFNCAGCGGEITACEGHASSLITAEVGGFGMLLCGVCYKKENEGRRRRI